MKKKKVRCLLNGKREDPIKNKELKEIERPSKKKRILMEKIELRWFNCIFHLKCFNCIDNNIKTNLYYFCSYC